MGASPSAVVLAWAADDKVLPALSFGVRVPGHGHARVHSIFARAANLQLPGRRLIVLLAAEYPNVPHGIRMAATAWARCRSCLRVGDVVHLESTRLRFPRSGVNVDLSTAKRWQVGWRERVSTGPTHGWWAHSQRHTRRRILWQRSQPILSRHFTGGALPAHCPHWKVP